MSEQRTVVQGYLLKAAAEDRFGGPAAGGWVETIEPQALVAAVQATPTVPLRLGIDGPIIGQVLLTADDDGIRFTGSIPEHLAQRVRIRDDIKVDCSYRVRGQEWSEDGEVRDVTDVRVRDAYVLPKDPPVEPAEPNGGA